jgi:1-acyl-sn-glycerol-3-phosphate acyltransferase
VRGIGFWRRFAVFAVKPVIALMTQRSYHGLDLVPANGGAILVANHLSHFDPLVAGHYVYEAGRWPQFLGKATLFTTPVIGPLLRAVRQIPVQRGTAHAAKALDAAVEAVGAGDVVIIYPEGTVTGEPDLWPMVGKTGAARLALVTGAPVIPVVMWGPQRIWDPRVRRWRLRPRSPVTVVTGPPVDLSTWAGMEITAQTLHEITDVIMLRLRDMLAEVRGESSPPPLWTPRPREDRREAR